MIDRDIVVAGGGPVAAMFCLALRDQDLSVLQIRSEARAAERPIALSWGSRQLIEQFGAWPDSTPIQAVHVSQQGGFGRTLIRAAECGLPALGYVSRYSSVLASLPAAGESESGCVTGWRGGAEGIEVTIENAGRKHSIGARLLVIADGGEAVATGREREYGQVGLVAEVFFDRPHCNIAWERFGASGPIAILPYQEHHALIWSTEAGAAARLLEAGEPEFVSRLQSAFGMRAGVLLRAGPRAGFPLALRVRHAVPDPRVVLIGNAAQTLHPVAGQGLNLGLRDAIELAGFVASAPREDIGSAPFLRRYAGARRLDRAAGIGFTDALVRAFSNRNRLTIAARGAALTLLDIVPPARRFLARRMIFGARALP